MLTSPAAALLWGPGTHWTPTEVLGSPFGRLFCAVCNAEPPAHALALLLQQEVDHSASVVSADRRREWIGGRICLAAALDAVGAERQPLLVAASGAPLVPIGSSGAISHKGRLVVALAASQAGGLGVDVECCEPSDAWLSRKILTNVEMLSLPKSPELAARAATMHFSIKEAVYKSLPPSEQEGLEFDDIETVIPHLSPREWLSVRVEVVGSHVRCAIMVDGDWIVALAARDERNSTEH